MALHATRLLHLAWRESRTARRRLLLYMSSISLGVGALVAIDRPRARLAERRRDRARAGVDVRLDGGGRAHRRDAAGPDPRGDRQVSALRRDSHRSGGGVVAAAIRAQ